MSIEVIPLSIKKEIDQGYNLVDFILSAKPKFQDGDVLILSQKIISKQEGRVIYLPLVIPSILAVGIGSEYDRDPKLVEVILSESKRIVRMENGILVVETKNNFVCANAGIDESNVGNGFVTLLPKDPDKSARTLREEIFKKTGKKIAVLISDTFGRPFRMGQTDCAIGVSGMDSILDYQGKKDTYGKTLRITAIAIIDELCAAAELVKGKTLKNPAAIVRNYKFEPNEGTIKTLLRPDKEDLFK